MKNTCVFCESIEIESRVIGTRLYHQCVTCHGIFLDLKDRLSPSDEKKRYEMHTNSLQDSGYRAYLEKFIDDIMHFLSIKGESIVKIENIIDYGSGPNPCLVQLLREKGYRAQGWDPFFSPEKAGLDSGHDMVTCLEVAEHFGIPRNDFIKIAQYIDLDGFLGLGTHLLPEFSSAEQLWDFFNTWWYRQDSTHISFYSETSLQIVAETAGLEWFGHAGTNVYLFRKIREISQYVCLPCPDENSDLFLPG